MLLRKVFFWTSIIILPVVLLFETSHAGAALAAESYQQDLSDLSALLATRPEAAAVRVEEIPVLDGDVLHDPAWAVVAPLTEFWQTTPDEGSPASEKTEVRIAYSEDTLFFGVVCYDGDPGSLIVSDRGRDDPLDEIDSFQIILDTYLDRQNGFVFGTNPAGIEYDGQVSKEGQDGGRLLAGGQQAGSGGGFNLNWDGQWDVATLVSGFGWSAEFAIPLRTLRYRSGDGQVWGLNFQRNIRRRNESAFWAPLRRQYNLYRLSSAGTLTGLDLQQQRNLKWIPYVLGQVRHREGEMNQTNWLGEWGTDFKYGVTPSLTLDLTYNTDFAQVEVDEQQINLDRFNLFFPEKRPFFLENAGLFSVGQPGNVELFFSRRIGVAEDGQVVPILAGARLSGKMGSTNVGFLNMQTEGLAGSVQSNNFTVARASRELPNRSSLGAVFVNRQGTGELAPAGDHNRTFGLDGRLGFGEYGSIAGYLAGTSTPGLSGSAHAYQLQVARLAPGLDLALTYSEVGENFNPEVGFLQRSSGYRSVQVRVFSRLRLQHPKILELRPHISYRGWWNRDDGFLQSDRIHIDNHVEWRSGYVFESALNLVREGVEEDFEIADGVIVPAGNYQSKEADLIILTNEGAWVSFDTNFIAGGFFGGEKVTVNPSLRMRLGETFNATLGYSYNNIDLPGGMFTTNLAQARLSYSFNPKTALQALIQYNDKADLWSANLRFSWLESGNNGLFLVFNTTRQLGSFSSVEPNRSLILKYSRVFDLLN